MAQERGGLGLLGHGNGNVVKQCAWVGGCVRTLTHHMW